MTDTSIADARTYRRNEKATKALALHDFYASQGIDLDAVVQQSSAHRFVRLNPRFDKESTLDLLKEELSSIETDDEYPKAIDWIQGWDYYAVPGTFAVAKSPCFRQGRIYGQDVNSGAAMAALLTNQFDKEQDGNLPAPRRILDLCCSPGLKLCAMADWLSDHESKTLVGVDVSESRMAICKRIVQKYQIDPDTSGPSNGNVRVQLYAADGTTFGPKSLQQLVFDSDIAREESVQRGKRKRMNKSARAREQKRLKSVIDEHVDAVGRNDYGMELFDYVLVDAECSTDGSLKHLQKRLAKGKATAGDTSVAIPQLADWKQLAELVDLQKRLAASGFRLLRPGGFMVYSTCSLSVEQNEAVVEWLLANHSDAKLVPVGLPGRYKEAMTSKHLPGTIRFLPNGPCCRPRRSATASGDETKSHASHLFGEGFYLAKVRKAE